MACISTKIEVDLARLDLCTLGHADHTSILNDVGVGLYIRYRQAGSIADLNRTIEIRQIRLTLCPLGHPEHVWALEQLAMSLLEHYNIQKNKDDLQRLIEMHQRWIDLCPSGHPRHARALGKYAECLWESFNVWGNIEDLSRAIEMAGKCLDLCPEGHPDNKASLGSLAVYINTHYQKQGNLMDLNRAIDLQEQHLKLCPSNDLYYGVALQNLALSFQAHYHKTKDHSDLHNAIKLLKKALDIYPAYHSNFSLNVHSLGETTLLLSNSTQRSLPPHQLQDEAFKTYRLLKKCAPATSLDLLKAVQSWVQYAEKYNHSSVLEAYQTSLNTLDHFTSLNSSVNSRHETMQARVADLVNNAFSCGTRHNDFQMAVEFLEQGRGILWNQLARFDVSMTELESQGDRGRVLGRKFTQLSTDLRKYAQGSVDKGTDPYWRVQREWQSIVDKIRSLDGFAHFLLPPLFDDLQHAAEDGPVVIVNASKYTCDALIVLRSRGPVHVSLPCSLADAEQLCVQLSELTRDAHAYGNHRESWVKEILRDLWSSVVEPIASALQNDVQLPLGSRVWWCPTSKFTTLPLHAAGPYRKGQKSFMDLYVSSYAPSLSGLIRTRERVRAQKKARDATGTANAISFVAVGQARPSADVKLGELVEVEHEIRRIRNETGMPPDVKFETITGEAATIEGAVQAFRDHRWVHVACHGAQHATKPFDSWFAMGDGKLTLMRIIQERYTNSEFAFLSACHTAVGDASTPDEVLHLAAGMQFAGFNGVIGTLWRVDDAVAHRFVTRFYQEMFKRPTVGFEHAAMALNTAAVETADEVSLEKRIVFVHIGI